jgi:hypothetical protein
MLISMKAEKYSFITINKINASNLEIPQPKISIHDHITTMKKKMMV